MKKSPCYYCTTDRHIGCHSECKLYNDWALEMRKEHQMIRNERNRDLIALNYASDTIRKNKIIAHK